MTERQIVKQERKFEGVWIPADRWLDKNLNMMEVVLITEIDSLDNEQGCFASNAYFSSFFGLSKSRISQLINGLKDKGYIKISYQRDGKQIKKRIIRVVNKLNRGIKNPKQPIKNSKQGYLENCEDNNTSINNTVINTSRYIYSQAEPDGVTDKTKTIIDYLNEKTDSHYKATTPKTKQLVQARIKEGFTVDDFKTVIDKKTATWLNDNKMNKYLRPLTLFGTKFEDYLNEKVKGQPNKNDPYYTEKINPMTGQPDPNGLTRYQMDNEYW